ncbi:hypothetical protein AKJ51_03445 [candidate division MSBL1 archaeon SCGC-AAA382A20]|uniref:Uncharacterized protein n=1 Tax=candidate division MSBL1 archaeon SCGC-AAA382A20 TaxID=1698280 RepID=A0A133VJF2_9EURY|nr:hypothetical protein AKJ51_03445 [candidate division MSBL1 archaeon SCGC-AAA382A20]
MRKKLKPFEGKRFRVLTQIGHFGERKGYKGYKKNTVLLRKVQKWKTGAKLTDHLWMDVGKQFQELGAVELDIIAFDARVEKYVKGYRGSRTDIEAWKIREDNPVKIDYRLVYPTKFELVELGTNH